MRLSHNIAIALSGVSWLGIGVFLLFKGFLLLLDPFSCKEGALFLPLFGSVASCYEQGSLILICISLFFGFIKGRWILAKRAKQVIKGILQHPSPLPLSKVYNKSYLFLIGAMMLLGFSLQWLSFPYDCRGAIDIAIGSALINGSAFYFRHLIEAKSKKSS